MHNLIVSALAGVVQGLTEFIPISSSAHLIIFQKYFETSMDIGLSFDVAVHLATALAVIFYFRKYLLTEIKEAIYFKSKIIINLISATIPAALVGFYFEPYIRVQFRSLEIVILGLVLGSLIIIAAEFYNRQKGIQNKEYSIFSSFIVGPRVCN
jgi:undecaprenyl-diphosphatase